MHSDSTAPLLVFDHTEVNDPMTFGQFATLGYATTRHWLIGADHHQRRVSARVWLDEVLDQLVLEPVLVEIEPADVVLVINSDAGGGRLEVRAHLEVGEQIVLSRGHGMRESDISRVELRAR